MCILISAIFIMSVVLSVCDKASPSPAKSNAEDKENRYMKEFYSKFCIEKNENILNKIVKCQQSNAIKEITEIQDQCISDIRKKQGKRGKPTLIENRDLDCDKSSTSKLKKCTELKYTPEKIKEFEELYPKPQLEDKARAFKKCVCAVYKIKYD